MIPYACPNITSEDRQAVSDALNATQITQGKMVRRFEEAIAEYTGAPYCIAVSSGTAALYIACDYFLYKGLGFAYTTPLTFQATTQAILRAGAKIEFHDIDLNTYNLPGYATVNVDFAGYPCEAGLIIDAAHSFRRNMYSAARCGCMTLSFHAIKNITTAGEGGAIITHNPDLNLYAKAYRNHGRSIARTLPPDRCGNYRMTHVQAAMGLSQLQRANEFYERKTTLWVNYDVAFEDLDIITPPISDTCMHPHLYVIRTKRRDELRDHLYRMMRSIETRTHYLPTYRVFGLPANCPNVEEYYRTALSIPFYSGMIEEDQNYVIEAIRSFYESDHH
jgi:dTDP-4-amino-4,6-dideoxygalactose transaminase